MDPPLRERISWRTSIRTGVSVPPSPATMARSAAALGAGGALIALLAIAVPHPPALDERLLAGLAVGTLAGCTVLILGWDRLPKWAFHVVAACGTGIASGATYAWGTDSIYGPLTYLWVVLYVCWFFPWRAAIAHLVLIAVAFGAVILIDDPPGEELGGWLATVATLGLAGYLIGRVRDRVAGLVTNLTDAARRDPLTDLLNRRGFEEVFDVELERARRADSPVSLIVGDLDRFKRVNDAHGHGAGDDVLRQVGRTIRRAKRSFDTAARVGGEEFAIVVPDTDEHGAYIMAERVRVAVERHFDSANTPLTISFGISTFPLHGQTAEALLKAGDQALYAAKRLGRNRSVISSAEVPGILARGGSGGHEYGHVEVATLVSLAEALDVRDHGNATHCHRVGRFAELIARELALAPDAVERVRLAGLLHDLGRVAIPDDLIDKPGPLSEGDWDWIRAHPETGARMLETTDFADVRAWIRAHHERPDGAGYPDGLEGEEVPLEARIVGVADAYEAMTTERAYRPAMGAEEAADELRRGAGRQFDASVVDALLRVV
jgi:diguanylate cyclase (GGDEF)-like protein/putative nucleotidyltransferase with HDIG domain